jgi:hypothetical protein
MASLAEIRARLQEQENKGNSNSGGGDGAVYPFWNLDEGSSSLIRFLPDENPDNTFFWVERQMIRLPFAGIKGGDPKPVTVQVPCVEMYGRKDCPVLNQVRPWFKDPSLEDMGRKYWKKRSYIFQGFVVEDGLKEDNQPENPIRRFIIGPQIFNIIKAALMDPDMEEVPTHYENGTDFRLVKTSKGQYADYSTSKWSRKERALDSAELAAIDEHGLANLNDFLPKEPNEQELQAIAEMFEASVDGEPYDGERWGEFYKPYGYDGPTGSQLQSTSPSAQTKTEGKPATNSEPENTGDEAPFEVDTGSKEETASSSSGGSADDILAMIRSRKAQ